MTKLFGKLKLGDKEYFMHDEHDKIVFKDNSNEGVKVDFSFSKDEKKIKLAKHGWREFWTKLFR
ncbi:hypothetical protein [Neobacillus soli]|uniref:hypothetical protein n=1 Tax=Neobacillus soli TaxID=220688 RepID=UPI00082579FD|nr:hypothetical protein [Neobacillus soli]